MKLIMDKSKVSETAIALFESGYARIYSENYIGGEDISDAVKFQKSYFDLQKDTYGGHRHRAYARLTLSGQVIRTKLVDTYSQSRDYNYTHGGVERVMESISQSVLELPLVRKAIHTDVSIAREVGLVDFSKLVRIRLHQIRYLPIFNEPSFSSPPWLHKDDEPIVFTHFINASSNIIGGDNVLSLNNEGYQEVVRLNCAFDTLLVSNHKNFHAVTPLSISSGEIGYRDIFLVTFQLENESEGENEFMILN